MSLAFRDRRSAERFAELLEATGEPLRRTGHDRPGDDRLAELVAVGQSLSAVQPEARVDPEFRVGLRAMLLATAERDGIGQTTADHTEPATPATEPSRGVLGRLSGRRIRTRGLIVVGVAAGAMAVSGISAASENAYPGDTLYGVKRSTEKAQLAMAGSDVTRGQLSLDFAKTRLAEAVTMHGGSAALRRVLDDMDDDTRQGVKLLTMSAVARRDASVLNTVDQFVAGQLRTFRPALDRLETIDGERTAESIGLLDDIRHRTEALRSGLACDTVASAGADSLGPVLRPCADGAGDESIGEAPGSAGAAAESTATGATENAEQHTKMPATGTVSEGDASNGGTATGGTANGGAGNPATESAARSGGGASSGVHGATPGLTPTTTMTTTPSTGTPAEGDGQAEDSLLGKLLGGVG
ncbi:DUF5667 domain-containing protein [Mangrovihabitans endophyticus]|uniref:DUF5667 domain-containing protein n=1 Tax=Mangrovihabitans endophyticus TaxID=1751298 RepID=A0A8J3BZ54_9ACTN|nr:DUF5667 domain-containing protein [Mangrovihabitans endophyticus]GGK83276.1 hypothetical protein GCM10012284_16710 [Mangrovihabitans endophyticus]